MKVFMAVGVCLVFTVASALADVTEKKEFKFDLQEGGRISLSNINGDVAIQGVAGDEVRVVATKKAGSQEMLDNLEIDVQATPELIRIETHHPKTEGRWFHWGGDGSGSVSYQLEVPAGAQLDTIETVNGDIDIKGVKGAVRVESVNGAMKLEGLAADASLDTVNGTIDAQFDILGGSQRVKADAVNGRIELTFPENADAQIHAETLNGGIDAEAFGLKPEKGFVGRDLDGQIGAGAARVNVDTVNGSVSIRRNP
jgi:DUF4097 and DUF4098 domain-containing protein YvlB